MEREKLNEILENHKLWLNNEGGACANLKGVNLRGVNLRGVDLRYANLYDADLKNANLRDADLRCTHLRYANLKGANLMGTNLKYADLRYVNLNYTNLYGANLSSANLRYANLRNTDLYSADLSGANLYSADLSGANLYNIDLRGANLYGANLTNIKTNIHTIGYNLACPEEGSFIRYKKAKDCIIKLLILKNSKRSSATTLKCRCDKAKVLDIEKIDTGKKVESISSSHDNDFIYKVGEIVKVDDFDENRWNECSTGIHFFMNKQNAIKY